VEPTDRYTVTVRNIVKYYQRQEPKSAKKKARPQRRPSPSPVTTRSPQDDCPPENVPPLLSVTDVHPFVASLIEAQPASLHDPAVMTQSPEARRVSGQDDDTFVTPAGIGIANTRGRLTIVRSDVTPAPETFTVAPRIPGRPIRPPSFNDGPSPRSKRPTNSKLQLYMAAFHRPDPPPVAQRPSAQLSSVTHQNGSLPSSQRPSRGNSPAPTPPTSPSSRQPSSRRYHGRASRIVTSSVFGGPMPHPMLSPHSQFSQVSNTSSGSRPPPKPFPIQPSELTTKSPVGGDPNSLRESSPHSQRSKSKQPSPPQPHRPSSQLSMHSRQRRDSIFRVGGYRRPSSALTTRSPPTAPSEHTPSVPVEIAHLVPGGSFTRYI
jgi:hypothetical protein